jgi:hypothetical protein
MGVQLGLLRRGRFENIVLSKLLMLRRDSLTGNCRRRHNEKLHDVHISPNIVRLIKTGRMRLAGNVARIRIGEVHVGFWWEILRDIRVQMKG